MPIYESGEDYLEAILIVQQRKGNVRSIDIVDQLGFSKPSVSVAMKHLREAGYITMASDGHITLTQAGNAVAQRIYTRHRVLSRFFEDLGVDPKVAVADACKIEHDLSDETFEKLWAHALQTASKKSSPPAAEEEDAAL